MVMAAREGSAIVVDPVVGDFHVMVPGMQPDTAAALRTVGEGQAIEARWVAKEVAGVCGAIRGRYPSAVTVPGGNAPSFPVRMASDPTG